MPTNVRFVPSARVCDRFIIGNRLYLLGMASGAIEADGRSPVMQDQRDVLGKLKRLEPCIHVARLVDKAVGLGRRLAGPAHSHEIGRQTPAMRTYERNDIAPLIRPGWIAVQKDDGFALSHINVANLGIARLDPPPRQVVWAIRFHGGDDRVTSCRIHKSDTCGRESSQDKTPESAACPLHFPVPILVRWSIAVM